MDTRTRSTGPSRTTRAVVGTADVAYGRLRTIRRGPSFGSWIPDATSGAVPRSVIAVAVPRCVTRRSRIAGEKVCKSSFGPIAVRDGAVEPPAPSPVEGPAPSDVEGPAPSDVEGPAPSDVEGSMRSASTKITLRELRIRGRAG